MNLKKDIPIHKSQIAVFEKTGNKKVLLNNFGVISTSKNITKNQKMVLDNIIQDCVENIPDNWLIEGNFINNDLVVKYVCNDDGEVIDVDDTILWGKIWGLRTANIDYRGPLKFLPENFLDNRDVRNAGKFKYSEKLKNISKLSNTETWRQKIRKIVL